MIVRVVLICLWLVSWGDAKGQTLGGSSVYNFLRLQLHPQAGALGGRNVSHFKVDPGMVTENPALLRENYHASLSANFTSLAPTVTGLSAAGAYHLKKPATTMALGVTHLLYGEQPETDAAGNVMGQFKAYDQMISITASRKYGQHWFYGAGLKFINSRYGAYTSLGLALDVGLNYHNDERMIQFGFAAKNMGMQLKSYNNIKEDLPFDLVLGVTKQLDKAPIRFSITAQRLHQFDILYNDTLFMENNFNSQNKTNFGSKLVSHFILGTDILVGDKLVLTGGYNFLRRRELRIQNVASGLTGFSYGFCVNLERLRLYYARTHYQSSLSHHQISFFLRLAPQEN